MGTILLLLHTQSDGSLPKAASEAVSAVQALGAANVVVGLVGGEVQAAANQIAACGAFRFVGVSGSEFSQPRYATDAAAAEAIWRIVDASIILASGTSRWMRALPGVAQRLGGRVDTHVVGARAEAGSIVINRWYYRQRIEVELARAARPWMVLLDPGAHPPWLGEPGVASVEELTVAVPEALQRTSVTGLEALKTDQQTIRSDAALLLVAGAGWTKKQKDGNLHTEEAGRLILDFVGKAQCSLGSSKSLVDLSSEGQAVLPFLTHLHQVGQTGSTPRHPKGLATCCHGEEPHAVGWRFIRDRRAINLDPACGWARGKADVLYVADAFEVMREVNKLL